MIRLSFQLSIRSGLGGMILAGIAAFCIQATEIEAQDRERSGKTGVSEGQRKSTQRDRQEFEKESTSADSFDRSPGQAGKRRPDFSRDERDVPSRFFLEGDFESSSISEGFVFVNGDFLSRPYTFRSSGKLTFVNGVKISEELISVTSAPVFDDGDDYESENRGRGSRRWIQRAQQTYAEFLSKSFSVSRMVIVAFDGRTPALLLKAAGGNDLLSVLVSESRRSAILPELLKVAGSPEAAFVWSDWITRFQPSVEFLTAAKPIVDAIDAVIAEMHARRAAIRRLESYAYPLTIVGMMMSVFAIGHLMSNPPNGGKIPDEVEESPEVEKIVIRSLMLVVALSLLDLIWTLLASQAGTMRELNPVGSRLINDPTMLILFKVVMTGLAAGLIFKLRYYRRAQLASWWACLILTLLTVRWLTFNSMLA